ncbi:MAG: DUF1638 domain-containing protein [bacterium]
MADEKLLLIGCGILKKEINFLIRKNNWPVETQFSSSLLHLDFSKLSNHLESTLHKNKDRKKVAFYGCCHPNIDSMLSRENTPRTFVQNCNEILLGKEVFNRELEKGAYFLLEDWVKNWQFVITNTFGTKNLELIKEIFHEDRKYLLGIRTPCSNDYTVEAEKASEMVGLPLEWMDVTLDYLEHTLNLVFTSKMKEFECQN